MSLHHRTDIINFALPGGITLTTVSAGRPGPSLALLGGVHGDEDEGVLATARIIHEVAAAPLAGTLRAVTCANPPAWAAQSRFSPLDGANLARLFPGTADDGPTSAAAAAITEHVITGADALVDLHSAGLHYRMPLMVGLCADTSASTGSQRLAEAFAAPLTWIHPYCAPGRSLSVAADLGIPAIYAESSGGGSVRAHELDVYVSGVLNVMVQLDMLPESYLHAGHHRSGPRPATTRVVRGAGDLDQGAQASHHGLFVTAVAAGDTVTAGAQLGRFYNYSGELLHSVDAPSDGVVMFLRRRARTAAGDVLFVLADLDDGGSA